jgi:hypothetical protein
MNLYQLAQQITDDVLGKGSYIRLNKFDPSRGETHQQFKEAPLPKLRHKREPKRNP